MNYSYFCFYGNNTPILQYVFFALLSKANLLYKYKLYILIKCGMLLSLSNVEI